MLAGSRAWIGWQAVQPGQAGRQQGLDRLAVSRAWLCWQAAGPGLAGRQQGLDRLVGSRACQAVLPQHDTSIRNFN